MANAAHCPWCGAVLPERTPGGLCPGCELRGALNLTGEETQVASSSTAPANELALSSHAALSHPDRPASRGLETSRQFGDYELVEEIARGGMGVVYKARQKSLDRIVAIKMILGGPSASKEFIHRFRTEAAAAANLQHPNIVAVHEVGAHEGENFLAMDFVDGPNLAHLIGQQPLPAQRAGRYLKAVAEAIHYAHERGILHRDLKPSNILIGSDDQPRVTDFGLAKRLEAESELTLSGQVLGSPNYMSPEQASGKRGQVGKRSDIYSLGAVLYHLLTARPPFQAGTMTDTLQEVLNTEPVSPRLLNPSVPLDLETICLKCLEKEPEKRYQTAKALAEELTRFLNDETILARPVTRPERTWRWCRRNPVVASLGAATVTLLLAVAIGSPIAVFRISREKERAETHAQQNLTQLIRSHVARGNSLTEAGDLFGALPWFAEALRLEPLTNSTRVEMHRLRLAMTLQQCPRLVQVLFHPDQVNDAQFSPDGTRIATACRDGRARIWDFASGQMIAVLTNEQPVQTVSFSVDGRKIATGSGRWRVAHWNEKDPPKLHAGEARVWDAFTGQPLSPWMYHSNSINSVTFSPDGQRVATSSIDQTAVVWDAVKGRVLVRFAGHLIGGNGAEFSPDGKWVLSGDKGGTVAVWDANSGRTNFVFSHPTHAAGGNFSTDGQRLLIWSGGGTARVWDAATGQPISAKVMSPGGSFSPSTFSPDGQRIVTSTWTGKAQVWDANTGEAITSPLPHAGKVNMTVFSPDGRWVLSASEDKSARVWDATTGQPVTPPFIHSGAVKTAVFRPDGRFVLTSSHDHTARVWDLAPLESSNVDFRLEEFVLQARFSPDGSRILVVSSDDKYNSTMAVWSATSAKLIKRLSKLAPGFGRRQGGAVFSSDGRWLVAKSGAPEAGVWNAESLELVWKPRHDKAITSICLSTDSRRVITASYDHTAQVWDVATGQKLLPPLQHDGVIECALFSPDDRRIVTASRDGTARVWDGVTGKPVTPPLRHKDEMTSAAFSHDGHWVITGSMDGTARVWDAATGSPSTPPLEHTLAVSTVEFSSDDTHILTASADGVAQVWEAATGQRTTLPLQHRETLNLAASFSHDARLVVTAGYQAGARVWDARTGEPVSTPLHQAYGATHAAFSPEGRSVMIAGGDGIVHLWTLPRDERSAGDWIRVAQLLAGSRIDTNGLVTLDLEGQSRQWQTLCAKYPLEFTPLTNRTQTWHEHEAGTCEPTGKWAAAFFHLNRLLEATPNDPVLRKRRALAALHSGQLGLTNKERAYLFALRDTNASANLIDLSPCYNRTLASETHLMEDLSDLPQGLHVFKGVEFDVRGVVNLSGRDSQAGGWRDPEQILGIKVERKGRRLHFLHANREETSDDKRVGAYIVHYANGMTREIPLVYGRDLRWWWVSGSEPLEASNAPAVWTGKNQFSDLRLFHFTWTNPLPDVEVTSIDFVSAMAQSSPFLIALTVEP